MRQCIGLHAWAGAGSPPTGHGLAVVPSLVHWHEVGRGCLPRGTEIACSQPNIMEFSHFAEEISGALRGLLLAAQGTCLNFSSFEAGWHQLCHLQVGCHVHVQGYAGCRVLWGKHGGKPGQWAGSWGCLLLCMIPQHPFRRAAVATGVCHPAFAMLWGAGTSQGAISAGKSERKRQIMAGLCHVLQQQHRNMSML